MFKSLPKTHGVVVVSIPRSLMFLGGSLKDFLFSIPNCGNDSIFELHFCFFQLGMGPGGPPIQNVIPNLGVQPHVETKNGNDFTLYCKRGEMDK